MIVFLVIISCVDKGDVGTDKELKKVAEKIEKVYIDSFEDQIKPFWKLQLADSSRIQIVKDPTNEENEVLRVDLMLEDYVSGGYRSELVIKNKDSFGYKNNHSFKFMLPEEFFQKEEKKGLYVIHQWHDTPWPGFTWATNKNKTHPPAVLFIQHYPNGDFKLIYKIGVLSGSINEIVLLKREANLEPNKWYTFSCEMFWSLYSKDGYFKPTINGEYFTLKGKEVPKIYRRNMTHIRPAYWKFGLYRDGKNQTIDRFMYIDDFKMTSSREHYEIPEI